MWSWWFAYNSIKLHVKCWNHEYTLHLLSLPNEQKLRVHENISVRYIIRCYHFRLTVTINLKTWSRNVKRKYLRFGWNFLGLTFYSISSFFILGLVPSSVIMVTKKWSNSSTLQSSIWAQHNCTQWSSIQTRLLSARTPMPTILCLSLDSPTFNEYLQHSYSRYSFISSKIQAILFQFTLRCMISQHIIVCWWGHVLANIGSF